MKVLYIDPLCPKGHKVFNNLTLTAIKKIFPDTKLISSKRCTTVTIDIEIPQRFFFEISQGY